MSRYTKFFTAVVLLVSMSTAALAQTDLTWFREVEAQALGGDSTIISKIRDKLQLAITADDTLEQIALGNTLGYFQFRIAERYESAMDLLIETISLEVSAGRSQEEAITYMLIGQLLTELGEYPHSEEAFEKAIALNEKRNTDLHEFLLTQMGYVNFLDGKLDDAYENFENVIREEDNIHDQEIVSDAYFYRGEIKSKADVKTALEDHKKSLDIRRSLKDEKKKAESHTAIAHLYHVLKNDQRSLDNHVVAFEIRGQMRDTAAMAESLNHIGTLYAEQKKFDLAIENLKKALEYGRHENSNEAIQKSLEQLSFCYRELGDFERALRYRDDYSHIIELIRAEEIRKGVLAKSTKAEIQSHLAQISNLQEVRRQKELEIKNQKQIQLYLWIAIGLGGVIALLILYLYVSNRRSTRKLRIINQKVQEQNQQLQELNATKDKFFSIISHDLKGPLNSLTSFSGLLINHTDSLSKDEIQLLAKDLDKSVKNLFNLLENLLEWSRSQTGNIEFKQERFDVASLLELNKQLLETQAQTKNITIVNENTRTLPVNVHKHSVNTVIRNLISNAIKFTPQGGKIVLSAKSSNNSLQISIADNGVGMSKEIMAKLFRIDTKITTKGTSDEKGTGLGLILCKDFIEKNGGKIWVESEVGKGSVFHFTLPALAHAEENLVSI
jgi:signal transduction histidine kinase